MQPIFNFGHIRAGIDLADARQKEAYLNYERTVLESLRLADLRYREGISSFLDVLDAQRVLYLEELNLAQSQAQTTLYLIA